MPLSVLPPQLWCSYSHHISALGQFSLLQEVLLSTCPWLGQCCPQCPSVLCFGGYAFLGMMPRARLWRPHCSGARCGEAGRVLWLPGAEESPWTLGTRILGQRAGLCGF